MQAQRLIFPDRGHCEIEDFTINEDLRPGQVLIRTTTTLISAGTELAMFTRTHRGFDVPGFDWAKYPFRPGYSAVGEVSESNGDIPVGTRVAFNGPHATLWKIDQEKVVPIPPGPDEEHATFMALLRVAMTAPRGAPARIGAHVLVIGMGIVGNLAAQLYALGGAGRVLGADLSEKRLERARACGINATVCTAQKPLKDCLGSLAPHGAELVIEAVGSPRAITDALAAAADGGMIVLLGSPRQRMEFDPYFDIHRKGVALIGAHAQTVDADTRRRDDPLLMQWLAEGRVCVAPLITHRLPWREAIQGYKGLRDRPDEYMGVILRFEPQPSPRSA